MENINDKMLTNAGLLFVLALLSIILLQWWMAPSYALTNNAVHEQINQKNMVVLPFQLEQMITNGTMSDYLLVALGDTNTDLSGFEKATHIPFAKLLDKRSIKTLKTADKILLMGSDESQSMMALNLLIAKGFSNVQVIANDEKFVISHVVKGFQPAIGEKQAEKAQFDYSRFFKNEASGTKSSASVPTIPTGNVGAKAAGGC